MYCEVLFIDEICKCGRKIFVIRIEILKKEGEIS